MNQRKSDHIALTQESTANLSKLDNRFLYEPLLQHYQPEANITCKFLNFTLQAPLWISSMTGGTQQARKINQNLAKAANSFGLGMGLGSCRIILEDDTYFQDFNLRPIIGNNLPLFANLGIAQIEKLVLNKQTDKIKQLLGKLKADGLIVHINPLQEFLQPEGDILRQAPITTIEILLEDFDMPIIVKEVGQGMGKDSLKALMLLPIDAIEFGAFGGTNFAKIELMRQQNPNFQDNFSPLANVGHTVEEMIQFVNEILTEMPEQIRCRHFIVSGGIKNFLDGFYAINKINTTAIYGQAANLLKYAQTSYKELENYLYSQVEGFKLAKALLKIR